MKALLVKILPYLLIIALIYSIYEEHKKVVRFREKSNTLETTISDLNQEVKQTKIKLNDSIELFQAEVKALRMTKNNIQARYDELLKASKLKSKDVGNVTEIVTVTHSVDTIYAEVDSFGGIKAELIDPYINIDVEITPAKQAIIDYAVRDSLTIISVQKKHRWLFGLIKWTEQKSIRVINNNPKSITTNITTIDVIE